ncbi:MAG: dephospho-CoA kinase [Bacteroidetes bacterium CG23_combo_of_CG06-09_8_20_14_all_32_9]|nr:MAG: dephospho-CoA kinase [Bacteroidetes bacterium CG23_combo_of_CG06-09_8_20_14_all_32_9]
MISVGLTGGIGSGKSVVSEMFKIFNIPTYNSDSQAKILMEINTDIKNEIIELLGIAAYTENLLNKQYIASEIFLNNTLRNKLNNIVHKYVIQDFMKWINIQIKSDFVILESAILFETGNEKINKFNITVISPFELKFKRLKKRGMTDSDINKRIASQWTDEQLIKLSDYIIVNDEQKLVSKQVLSIYKDIISKINVTTHPQNYRSD